MSHDGIANTFQPERQETYKNIINSLHKAQPDKFGSILEAMWWGVATLATIGYGDVYPVTAPGNFFGMLTAIAGIGIFALPAGIPGSGFVEEMEKRHACDNVVCPHFRKLITETSKPIEAVVIQKKYW